MFDLLTLGNSHKFKQISTLMNEKLKYDRESYKWSGTLNYLKCFVKEHLDIKGKMEFSWRKYCEINYH